MQTTIDRIQNAALKSASRNALITVAVPSDVEETLDVLDIHFAGHGRSAGLASVEAWHADGWVITIVCGA
jgi:hypothetical protein